MYLVDMKVPIIIDEHNITFVFRIARGPEFKTLLKISEIFNDLLFFLGGGGRGTLSDVAPAPPLTAIGSTTILLLFTFMIRNVKSNTHWPVNSLLYYYALSIYDRYFWKTLRNTSNENIDQKRVLADDRI